MKTLIYVAALVLPLIASAGDGSGDGHMSDYYDTFTPSMAPPQKDDTPVGWYEIDGYPSCKSVKDAPTLISSYAAEYRHRPQMGKDWIASIKSEHPVISNDPQVLALDPYLRQMRACFHDVYGEKWSAAGKLRANIVVLTDLLNANFKEAAPPVIARDAQAGS